MTRIFWEPKTKSDLIAAIYAMIDSGYWDAEKLSIWADTIILSTSHPQVWVLDISQNANKKSYNIEEMFYKIFIDNEIFLPDDFYDVCAGLILLQHKEGVLPLGEVRQRLADIADPGGVAGIHIEEIEHTDLDDQNFQKLCSFAEMLVASIEPKEVVNKHSDLVAG